ncbi:carbohydrate ABC transporter permease [Falseniella ignava]|uniref:Carbohydrate ABC transporter permease n=1 Tax=Falseniella ignava TaxID=137730 RepID=A0A2I1K4B2_9LACT|nr:carbohydrate ABC transporter permease [Falseniella ignava]PKY90488.1 carbohydrate ABC transporter permease [Falseniella ignava]
MQRKLRTAIVIFIGILINLPIIIMVISSLSSYSNLLQNPVHSFEWPPMWENYTETLFGEKSIIKPLINSLVVSGVTMVLCTSVAVLASYATTRYPIRFKKGFLYTVLLFQMFSPVLLSGPLYAIFNTLGILDTRLSLIIGNTASCLPMTIWLLYTYLQGIPLYIEEAARMDGCTWYESVFHVLLPMALPGIITASLFAFISAWGDIIFARSSILNMANNTLPLAIIRFEEYNRTRWDLQLAASTISTIPVFVFFMFIQNSIGRGLMQTSSKE